MTKQENNMLCLSMSIAFMLGVICSGVAMAIYENKRVYNVQIDSPLTCEIKTEHWAMESLK